MEEIVVEVRRNGVVEAVHRVDAVAVRGGEVIAASGDPELRPGAELPHYVVGDAAPAFRDASLLSTM